MAELRLKDAYVFVRLCTRRNLPYTGRDPLRFNYMCVTKYALTLSKRLGAIMTRYVSNNDSRYLFIDYQIHIKPKKKL